MFSVKKGEDLKDMAKGLEKKEKMEFLGGKNIFQHSLISLAFSCPVN